MHERAVRDPQVAVADGRLRRHEPPHATARLGLHQARAERRPSQRILFIQAITSVLGSTEEEARRRDAELGEWIGDEGMAAHLSGII
jgi:alkanesulfonate monooxygenase SsuD/methylene tetrahydromethanopterin reductase-like flavin-dependent oxidoreductase (luciferase family)